MPFGGGAMRSKAWCGIVLLAIAGGILARGPVPSDYAPSRPDFLLAQAKDKDTPPKPPEKPKESETPKAPEPPVPSTPPVPSPSPTPPAPSTPPAASPPDAFAQGPTRGGEAPGRGFNPHMLGDYQGLFARRFVTLPVDQTINTIQPPQTITQFVTVVGRDGVVRRIPITVTLKGPTAVTSRNIVNVTVPSAVPVTGPGAFKIAENESPSPGDRAYVTYNYFSGIRGPAVPGDLSSATTRTTTVNGQPAVVTETRLSAPYTNAQRGVFGFEQSVFDGAFSVGLRLPLTEQQADDSFAHVGDLTANLKYAILRDPETGSVLSAGLAVTAPTGPSIVTTAGDLHSTLFQPFVGYRLSDGVFFVQGFTSVSVPTKADFPTLLFNDVSIGYLIYRGQPGAAVSTVAPVVEAHLTTPLTGRGADAPLLAPDLLVLVAGVQVGVFGPSTLTLGVGAPVTGPRLFDVEAIVQFNVRF